MTKTNVRAAAAGMATRIERLMAERELDVDGLAAAARIAPASLRWLFHAPETFNVTQLALIANALGVSPAEFFAEDGQE